MEVPEAGVHRTSDTLCVAKLGSVLLRGAELRWEDRPVHAHITAVDDPADDHGDTLDTATDISLGEVVGGVVDDDFDYDYFRFRAVEGRRYRVSEVTGGTLEYFLISLYASDGAAPANWPWNKWNKIRDAASSDGHWFEWAAPSSKEYYIALDGAHGSVGTYRLRIFSVDNQPGD